MSILHLNDTDFADAVKSGVTLVDFWADWCGPCRMFGPVFEAAALIHTNIKFAKFEVGPANKEIPAKYGIRSIPSVLAFRDGELISAKTGLMQPADMEQWIAEIGVK
ncbi:MAG: thioredoxin domain-containing protein [Alphaproteobacteria bacterium]|nr:thioredoxin domain-containing protein [Alphaproteobacteria bacterium]MCL2889947.1 thioredoxin domain-containing protein [Alphaproteobacteria bacterium]